LSGVSKSGGKILSKRLRMYRNPPVHPEPLSIEYRCEQPNLSGNWRIKRDDTSTINDGYTRDLSDMSIVQRDPEIKIRRRVDKILRGSIFDFIYYGDNRGEINQSFNGTEVKSKTSWNGRSLIIRYKMKMDFDKIAEVRDWVRASEVDVVEKWEISKDGKMLTHRVNVYGMPNVKGGSGTVDYHMDGKEVFIRVP
jgi:hypothetical protein